MCCVSWSVFGISITICNRFLMSLSGVSSVREKMPGKCFPAPGAMFLHVECLLANWNILKIWRQGACSPLWRHCACQQSTTNQLSLVISQESKTNKFLDKSQVQLSTTQPTLFKFIHRIVTECQHENIPVHWTGLYVVDCKSFSFIRVNLVTFRKSCCKECLDIDRCVIWEG